MSAKATGTPKGLVPKEVPEDDEPFPVEAMDSAAFSRARFPLEWAVNKVLMPGQPAVIGGPKKTLKTSLLADMAVSISTGKPFLGHFAVPKRRRVAVFSGESAEAALQDTARRVCAARGVSLEDCAAHWVFRPPCLSRPGHRRALHDFLRREEIEVVFLDPLFVCLLDGVRALSAANLYEVGPALYQAARACLDAGATPVFVHHTTKWTPLCGAGGDLDLDGLAYAGVAEFVRQWVLVGRREPFRPSAGRHQLVLTAGGNAGHAGRWGLTVEEGVLGDDFSGRTWRVTVGEVAGEDDHRASAGSPRRRERRGPGGGGAPMIGG
jgi:replicative DNA helicase